MQGMSGGDFEVVAVVLMTGMLVFGFLRLVHSPIGQALADRLRGPALRGQERDDDLAADVARLREEVTDLQERVNFAERLLLQPPRPAEADTPV